MGPYWVPVTKYERCDNTKVSGSFSLVPSPLPTLAWTNVEKKTSLPLVKAHQSASWTTHASSVEWIGEKQSEVLVNENALQWQCCDCWWNTAGLHPIRLQLESRCCVGEMPVPAKATPRCAHRMQVISVLHRGPLVIFSAPCSYVRSFYLVSSLPTGLGFAHLNFS